MLFISGCQSKEVRYILEDEVFYVQRDVDSAGMVHYKKSARFPNTENGDVKEGTDKTMTQQHTSTFNMFRLR